MVTSFQTMDMEHGEPIKIHVVDTTKKKRVPIVIIDDYKETKQIGNTKQLIIFLWLILLALMSFI